MWQPLRGVRVVDLTWVGAGPVGTRLLAFLGADVIKVESRGRLDLLRTVKRLAGTTTDYANQLEDPDAGVSFAEFNAGKRGVTVNLKAPDGVTLVRRLVGQADVVAAAMRPGALERLGLGWEAVAALNPRAVLVTMSGSGRRGPQRALAAYASIFGAMSGMGHATGYPSGPPTEFRFGADMRVALVMSAALLAGLVQARRTGRGRWLDLSGIEALLSFCPEPVLTYQVTGEDLGRLGNVEPGRAPSGVYPCAGGDEWVAISVGSAAEWAGLCAVAAEAPFTRDPRFREPAGRIEHRAALDEQVGWWTRGREKVWLVQQLQTAGVPAAEVATARDFATDAHLQARRAWHTVDHPVVGPRVLLAPPQRCNGARGSVGPAPRLGEHNKAVFGGLLGLSQAELADLQARRALT